MDTVEILRKARKMIATEDRWLRRRMFNEDTGARCAYSALCAAAVNYPVAAAEALCLAMGSRMTGVYAIDKVIAFNDNNSHSKVLELFDKAIAEHGAHQLPNPAM